jgi:hypothetical protein
MMSVQPKIQKEAKQPTFIYWELSGSPRDRAIFRLRPFGLSAPHKLIRLSYCKNGSKLHALVIVSSLLGAAHSKTPFYFNFKFIPMDSQLQHTTPDIPLSPNEGSDNASQQTSDPSRPHLHIRSCGLCRSRKVKCDRQKPCANCVRLGSECIYPAGPGRAPKRPRQGLDKRVLDRLAHLEVLVRRLDTETEAGQLPFTSTEKLAASPAPEPEPGDGPRQVEQQLGRLVIDETRSCYVSNRLWASLGDEVCAEFVETLDIWVNIC